MVRRVISGKGYNKQLWFRYQHDGIADRKPNHGDTWQTAVQHEAVTARVVAAQEW